MMKKITKYYSSDEIVEAVLNNDPEFHVICQLIWDDITSDNDIEKIKNKDE